MQSYHIFFFGIAGFIGRICGKRTQRYEEVKRMQCKRGTGRFQWNTGGWFGAQVGSTCWLFFAAISFLSQTPRLAALLLQPSDSDLLMASDSTQERDCL